jgi:hypothetical protein
VKGLQKESGKIDSLHKKERTPLFSRGGVDATSRKYREASSLERTGWCGQEIYRTTPPRLREVGSFATFS